MTRYEKPQPREEEYRLSIRLATVAALVLSAAAFLAVRLPEPRSYAPRAFSEYKFISIEGLTLHQLPERPQVSRPKLPIADPQGKETDPSVGQHNWNDTVSTQPNVPDLAPVAWHMLEKVPQILHLEVPQYPELARQVGIEGRVSVKALVDTLGQAHSVELVGSSGNTLLDAAALEAARRSRFTPGIQNGRPVPVWMGIPFIFRLN